jgi:hypothetical protein
LQREDLGEKLMPTDADARAAKLQSSFQQLTVAASTLNQSSDQFGAAVSKLDSALTNLNLGVSAWFCYANYQDPEGSQYRTEEQLGYAKIGNRRGLALQIVAFDDVNDDYEVKDSWLFNDAPRELRLRAVEYIPELIDALVKETTRTAERVSRKAVVALELAAQVEKIAERGGRQ